MRKIGALLVLLLGLAFAPSAALAQSACQYIAYGAVLTAAQWNSCFQAKADVAPGGSGYLPLSGGTMTGEIITAASAAAGAGFNLPPGTAPSSPVNGDVWTTSAGIFARIGGTTYNLTTASLVGGTTPITGTCTSGYFLYNNSGVLGCQAVNSTITANSTPTSGFTAGQFLRSDGSLVQASAGITTPGTGQLALALGTITTNITGLSITATWNNSGTTFDAALLVNVTNTAAANPSYLLDLKVSGSSVYAFNGSGVPQIFLDGSTNSYGGYRGIFDTTTYLLNGSAIATAGSYFGIPGTLVFTSGSLGGGIGTGLNEDASTNRRLMMFDLNSLTTSVQFEVYNTTDSQTAPANYERGIFGWVANSNVLTIGTQEGGSGLARNVELIVGGSVFEDYGITNASALTLTSTNTYTTGTLIVGGSILYLGPATNGTYFAHTTTTNLYLSVGSTTVWDYAYTTTSVFTVSVPTTFSSATIKMTALANSATTSAVCYNTSTGLLTYDGTIGTCNTSDERLKMIDGPITGALAMLMHVDGVYFHGKGQEGMAQFGDGEHVGLIAQNVATVFPSLVQFGENGYASLAYDKLTAPIIASLHEIVDSCRDAANDNFCVQLLKRVNQR